MSKGINFGWYLNIWINILHNDERVFWRTMTPARLSMLYGEYFKLMTPRTVTESGKDVQKPKEPEKPRSLAAYMMGGG